MNILYLSEGEDMAVMKAEDILNNLVEAGLSSEDLKYIVQSIDSQGFFIGTDIGHGSFAIINLNLPKFTIQILPKEKKALESLKNYSSHV